MDDTTRVRRRLTGDRNQCPSCGGFFNSTHAFDAHRTGPFGRAGEAARRCCMSVEEMKARGMTLNAAGFWITRKSADRMRRERSQDEADADPAPENHRV